MNGSFFVNFFCCCPDITYSDILLTLKSSVKHSVLKVYCHFYWANYVSVYVTTYLGCCVWYGLYYDNYDYLKYFGSFTLYTSLSCTMYHISLNVMCLSPI